MGREQEHIAVKPTMQADTAIGLSVMNYLHASTLFTLAWRPMGQLVDIFEQAGYTGMEYIPNHLLSGWQLLLGNVSQYTKNYVTSAHQSWNGGVRELLPKLRKREFANTGLAIASCISMPERERSLGHIARVRKVVNHPLSIVVYSNEEQSDLLSQEELLMQPKPEEYHGWGCGSVDDFIQELEKSGKHVCLDLVHFRRADKYGNRPFHPWRDHIGKFLPITREIHFSAGRYDQGELPFDSYGEFIRLLKGDTSTELMQMLRSIKEYIHQSGRNIPMVTEIPAGVLYRYVAEHNTIHQRTLHRSQFINLHQRIVQSMREC
ncbi:hypothetical protein HY468_02210 [Candidatus Roizmanbacteria bacterium]|nr:hypothetical protein [Candidatus Roizmanbacteria bacterium]